MKKSRIEIFRNILPYILLGTVVFGLILANVLWGDHFLDSDMAAEMMFSDLVAKEGGLIASKNWYYSTEFRIIYTQLIMVPLFHILESWRVIRIVTNVVTYALLLSSYFFMMKPFGCKNRTVTYMATILMLPFSETLVTHMHFGNTYMFHVILLFICFGLFIRLAKHGVSGICGKLWIALYVFLSVICGMSGVRYVLALQAPLLLVSVFYLMKSREWNTLRVRTDKPGVYALCRSHQMKYVFFALLGLFAAMVGYVCNVAIIARNYVFQTYEATNFIQVFQGVLLERLQNVVGNLLLLFGYIANKGFLSIRGLISLLAFALLIGIALLAKRSHKLLQGEKLFTLLFFEVAFVLNTFVFLFTTSTMSERYYITVFVFVLPLLVFYFEKENYALDKMVVMLFLMGAFGLTSVKCVYSLATNDKNEDIRKAVEFLVEEEYSFGYATYWNGNIMTELSDGKIEVAQIAELPEMTYFRWSSPTRYYEDGYHQGKCFLLLTREEFEVYKELPSLQESECVYQDAAYVVFHYDNGEDYFK